jgi:putative membrane protein
MKTLNLIMIAASSALMMQACHNGNNSATTTDTTTTTTTDATKTDTSKMVAADTVDISFATKAAQGGMTEIALSKLELQSSNNKIKDFANMMVTDHTDAGNKLVAIAKAKNITLPTLPDTVQQAIITDLSKKSGTALNKAYVAQMVTDHKNTIAMFEAAQKTVKDTTLKAFITNTLPTLHKHMDAINAIESGM